MLGRLRNRLTFANVVSVFALFVALGLGTAWALERNSVRSPHIVNGQVKVPDLNRQLRPLWAVVDENSASPVIVFERGVVGMARISEGIYDVRFERSVRRCSFAATPRAGNSHLSAITTALNPPPGVDNDEVRVNTTDSGGSPNDADFSVGVRC